MRPTTLADKLESYRLLIFNSKDAEIQPLLKAVGVDNAYITQGTNLYNQAMALMDKQKKEYQEQSLAYDNFYVAKDEADDNYSRTYKLVKVMSRNNKDLQNRLKFQNGKSAVIEGWIEQGIDFYNLLQNETEFLATLAKFKITANRINAESKALQDLRTLRNQATQEKGQAQEATRLRNEKLDELADYCTELKALAEIALESQPQLLEKLGILVRS